MTFAAAVHHAADRHRAAPESTIIVLDERLEVMP